MTYECGIEPQFQCIHCAKRFTVKANMKRYIISIHKVFEFFLFETKSYIITVLIVGVDTVAFRRISLVRSSKALTRNPNKNKRRYASLSVGRRLSFLRYNLFFLSTEVLFLPEYSCCLCKTLHVKRRGAAGLL